MSSFQIRTHQSAHEIRFAHAEPASPNRLPAAATPSAEAPQSALDKSALHLTGLSAAPAPASELTLFAAAPAEAGAESFRERLSTRESQVRVGPEQAQLELGFASEAPEILTADRDPDLIQTLQSRLGAASTSAQPAGDENVLRTGARFQPHEGLELQLGLASVVSPEQLKAPDTLQPGVYAGMGLQMAGFSSKLAVDTAHGKARTEFGAAVQAGDRATLGLSFLHQAHTGSSGLRLGTEIKAAQDTVVGVNLNQPLNSTEAQQTAVGVYLNTRFR